MEYATSSTCRRTGCRFARGQRRRANGSLTPWCGAACYTWSARARRATRAGDVVEAAELLRLSDLLDARTNPREFVPGVFLDDAPRP
jgi:hypothetical protein